MDSMRFLTTILYKTFIVLLIILSLPLMIFISLLIIFSDGFPIFFTQQRVGLMKKPFTLFKFRTMRQNAEQQKKLFLAHNEARGPVFKIHNDPRFTGVGKVLSHMGLDELPQLFNIWNGTMAILGPRPLPTAETKRLKKWHLKRYDKLPGIISPWILEGYHDTAFDQWMQSDIDYIQTKSFISDLNLCARFIPYLSMLVLSEFRGFYRKGNPVLDKTDKKRYT